MNSSAVGVSWSGLIWSSGIRRPISQPKRAEARPPPPPTMPLPSGSHDETDRSRGKLLLSSPWHGRAAEPDTSGRFAAGILRGFDSRRLHLSGSISSVSLPQASLGRRRLCVTEFGYALWSCASSSSRLERQDARRAEPVDLGAGRWDAAGGDTVQLALESFRCRYAVPSRSVTPAGNGSAASVYHCGCDSAAQASKIVTRWPTRSWSAASASSALAKPLSQ
jgi:hypothetical protein